MSWFKSYETKLIEQGLRLKALADVKKKKEDEAARLAKLNSENIRLKDYLKPKGIDIKTRINRLRDSWNPHKTWLIHMEMRNGNIADFVIFTDEPRFNYMKGTYIIDDELKYYNISSALWALDYHQDISFPIRHKIDVNRIRKSVSAPGVTDVDTAINPQTLKQWLESDVIQKVMKGEELEAAFRFFKIMLIILVIVTGLTLIIMVKTSGILNNVKIPGLT